MSEPTVRMSGIVLASLLFQHVNSDSDVDGLILGESRLEEQITISDSQADHVHIEEIYHVQKHVACHQLNHFYSGAGDVDAGAVRSLLADNKQGVIGWYRQRRNSDLHMSFREKVVHEKLKSALSNPHMIFLLLTPSRLTPPGSTHKMEYAAFVSRSRRFLKVPVLVNNLGLLEQLSYWKVPAPCSAAGYDITMRKHGSRFFSSNGLLREVNEVNDMNESLQAELQKACREVENSERQVETLRVEVSALRRTLREKKKEKKKQSEAGKDDDPPSEKNLLLQEAIRALFSCSPLFLTQTLSLQASPVPDAERDALGPTQARSSGSNPRKRLKDFEPLKETKRRKSCS